MVYADEGIEQMKSIGSKEWRTNTIELKYLNNDR